MDDPKHGFQPGDTIRGKDSELRGRVLKILDAGYLMILETEFDMEMNVHHLEIVKDALNPLHFKTSPLPSEKPLISGNKKALRLDLHKEKLPPAYRNSPHPLEAQLLYLQERIAVCLQQGTKELTVIHGKGSGTLHQRIVQVLKSYSQIKSFTPLKAALEKPHGILICFK